MVQPGEVTARALSADGEILASTETGLEWTRVGGSEQCGGPMRATSILLDTDT